MAFLIGSALALGIQSTIEQFLRRGGYGNLEVQLASLDHALCHASEAEGAFTRTHNKVVETICQESSRAGFKLDCNLGKVPTFLNPAWNPASAPSVKQFRQADAVSKGKTPLGPTGVVMDFTLIHVYNSSHGWKKDQLLAGEKLKQRVYTQD